jgi:hypothetical protein
VPEGIVNSVCGVQVIVGVANEIVNTALVDALAYVSVAAMVAVIWHVPAPV